MTGGLLVSGPPESPRQGQMLRSVGRVQRCRLAKVDERLPAPSPGQEQLALQAGNPGKGRGEGAGLVNLPLHGIEPFALDWIRALLTYFGWAILQQILILGYVFRRLSEERLGARGAILVSAAIFGMLHLPNIGLVALATPSALVWTWVYSRHGNLLGVAISHGIIATIATQFLDMSTKTGIDYLENLIPG